jgi:hypothetical protein
MEIHLNTQCVIEMAPSPLHPRHISDSSSYFEEQAGAPPHWVHCVLLGSLLTTVAVQPGRCHRFIGTLFAPKSR